MSQANSGGTLRVVVLLAAAAIIPACGHRDGGGGAAQKPTDAGLKLLAKGGQGGAGNGGNGNYLYVYGNGIGGDVKVVQTGTVNATPPAIAFGVPFLGSNPKTVSSDMTLSGVAENSDAFNGDDGATEATGLHVLPGVTLMLDPNDDTNASAGTKERVWLDFNADPSGYRGSVFIEGTVVIGRSGTSTGNAADVLIYCQNFVIATGGSLVIEGTDAPGGTGGTGGYTQIYPDGDFVSGGTISGTGGDGDTGGRGLQLYVNANYSVYNSGLTDTSGGDGAAGAGGQGGYIDIEADDGPLFNSGSLLSRGGQGTTAGGNGGSYVYVDTDFGSLYKSGIADCSGGDCTDNGNGGNAGYVEFDCYQGEARYTGTYLSRGGEGGPNGGDGGNGDEVYFYSYNSEDYHNNNYVSHHLWVAVSADASGGDAPAGNGGHAGDVYIENTSYGYAHPRSGITVIASEMNVDAGHGTANGGSAGSWSYIENDAAYDYNLSNQYSTAYVGGMIYNEVPFFGRGGDGGSGAGGNGAYFDFYSYQDDLVSGEIGITNVAPIDISGGNGATDGGDAGYCTFEHYTEGFPGVVDNGISNSGDITARGGDAGSGTGGGYGWVEFDYYDDDGYGLNNPAGVAINSGVLDCSGGNSASGDGGIAGGAGWYCYRAVNSGAIRAVGGTGGASGGYTTWYVEFYVDTDLTNTGPVDVSGGHGGTGDGGYAGYIYMEAGHIANSAALTARGGDSASAMGGDGNYVEVWSSQGPSSLGGTTMDCRGGTGSTGNGADDYPRVDGFLYNGPVQSF
ncbi:MAG: hypothetical protein HY716_18065 [Planctomycetes bacterium]|nr:hypothetical protein [Planctomycetota bacterium]